MSTAGTLNAALIAQDLAKLGIVQGDTLYVRARLSAVGRIAAPVEAEIVRALKLAVGEAGLVVAPAFTPLSWRWQRPARFLETTPTTSGLLGRALLAHKGAQRSSHPTHSFVAVGREAANFVCGHDATRAPFWLVQRLVSRDARMLIIGCNDESPGFSTVHLVQEEIGLSQRHYTRLLYRTEYIDAAGKVATWKPHVDPGCSRGFDKAYRHYIADDNFHLGRIGAASTIRVDAARAYAVEKRLLSGNPRALLCDHLDCVSCRVLRGYNLAAAPGALARIAVKNITRRLRPNAGSL